MALNSNYQEVDIALTAEYPNNRIIGKVANYYGVSLPTLRVKLNPSSTQDFFASGEFVKKVSVSNNVLVVDLVDAIDDDVIGVLEKSNQLVQKAKISNNATVQVYDKEEVVSIIDIKSTEVDMTLQGTGTLAIGDAVEPATSGDLIQKYTTGTKLGTVLEKRPNDIYLVRVSRKV